MQHNRRVLSVKNEGAEKFLNDLLTVEIYMNMPLTYGALLSPQGKLLTDLFIWADATSFFLDLPIRLYDDIRRRLTIYKMRANVVFDDMDFGVFQSLSGMSDPRHSSLGARSYGPQPEDVMNADDYLKRRIEAIIPEFDEDFQENQIYPIEWRFVEMKGIDFKKGCYVGQEIAARMKYKAELKKNLYRAKTSAPMHAEIFALEKQIGQVLSKYNDQALIFIREKAKSAELKANDEFVYLV